MYPKGEIIEILSRHRLLEKPAGIEDSVIGLKICMPVDLPSKLSTRPVPYKACEAVVSRPDQGTRNVVYAIE